jgi:streptogramin lyase
MRLLPILFAAAALSLSASSGQAVEVTSFALPEYPHDAAPAPDGGVWFTAPDARGDAEVRQLNGRKGEVWAPESGTNHLVRYKFE